MNAYAKNANAYLSQRILGASPEQQAALIMEAGQLHLGRAIQALNRSDFSAATSSYIRVAEVIQEATIRLNLESGGELAHNLAKTYDWWTREIMAASRTKDTNRLAAVALGMGEIRQAWEQLHKKKLGTGGVSVFQLGDRVG
jgi:flagellar biosynthetic protein FliS